MQCLAEEEITTEDDLIIEEDFVDAEIAEEEIVTIKKVTNNYFNEEYVKDLIFKFQATAKTETIEIIGKTKNKTKVVITEKDDKLEHLITIEILKVVKAVIQVYRYYVFEPYDDCVQHGIMNCITNYIKFHPSKGTAFNFFSIIAKRSLLNYTDRKKKHRNLNNIDDQIGLKARQIIDFDFFLEELYNTLGEIINQNFLGKKRKMYLKISKLLADYLFKTKKYISKTDFYTWCRSYGIRSIDVRDFILKMNRHEPTLFEGVNQVEEDLIGEENFSIDE